ncbi:MAG: hypothetical protein JXA78_10145 [Anaerolineales bacterium]|nr:hypothetical protein [Anaerolineales bacterium]
MDKPIELTPLVCLRCSTAVPAEIDEVAWVCAQCGQGLALDEEDGLKLLEVNYAAGIPANTRGKPYWVVEGRVQGLRRESYRGGGKESQQAEEFWGQPRHFFIPAYRASLETLLERATQLLLQPPPLQPGPAAPFEPVTLFMEDIRLAAEFIVMAVEAGRKDRLKKVDFSLQLSPAVLWVLP